MNPTAAIVSGVIFGTIFVLTCIISAVKAVRDRKRIKQRIAEKNRLKQQTGSFPRQNGVSIEEIICVRDDSRARRLAQLPDGGYAEPPLPPPQNGTYPHNWNSKNGAYSGKNGVDNLTYSYSSKDIKQKQETLQMPLTNQVEVEILPPNMHPPTKRSHSACAIEQQKQRQICNLSQECLAVKKLLRRHSYETAVYQDSWLPSELPAFASSEAIVNTYSYGGRNAAKSSVGFENRAYNRDDRY